MEQLGQGERSGGGGELQHLQGASVERPSLQLRDVEGRIHKYEGALCRKSRSKKPKLKKNSAWKRRWFRVSPGQRIREGIEGANRC